MDNLLQRDSDDKTFLNKDNFMIAIKFNSNKYFDAINAGT